MSRSGTKKAPSAKSEPVREREASGTPADADATRKGQVYELGPLNRHWYRRCLDALDSRLQESSSNPSVQDLKDLCDDVVTGFLTAITGQARDSSRLQFPADRAYFIPFEGDLAESFNFTKPFYRIAEVPPEGQDEGLQLRSVWSFYPWVDEEKAKIEIDSRRSVDAEGATIAFEEMVSVRAQFVKDDVEKREKENQEGPVFVLEKSLVVRGKDRTYPEMLFFGTDDAGEAKARKVRTDISKSCADSMLGIFDVYRKAPGNVAIESILLNHVTVIRWLLAMLGQTRREVQEGKIVLVSEQDKDFKDLFLRVLRYMFLGLALGEGSSPTNADDENKVKNLASLLEPGSSKASSGNPREEALALLKEFASRTDKVSSSAQRKKFHDQLTKDKDNDGALEALRADLESFRKYLLQVGSEDRIAQDLTEALAGKLLKAGETRQSFVWVTPDFEKVNDSLVTEDFQVGEDVQSLSADITKAYKTFYQRFDEVCLEAGGRRDKLEAYWRTLGQTNREQLVYSSFDKKDAGLYKPRIRSSRSLDASRPQNFFVRVRICDSLNEPVINGLFVLSTDHDEVMFKGKEQSLRKEDREDLLAFSKVYFFIVREYFRALDQAQEARDIGRLNQYLYDRRLSELDERMQRRAKTQEFSRGNITDRKNWSLFSYEILNNYAFSLIEKLDDVQSETFPYDRLLILPLGIEREEDYYLPFFLFQAIFAERLNGEIRKGLYSLIKPFQSPVEEKESEPGQTRERFRVKSFQKVSKTAKGEVLLERYLEKLYVSADGDVPTPERPQSFVVKLVREGAEADLGKAWAQQAIATFWVRRDPKGTSNLELWLNFLHRLTQGLETLQAKERTGKESGEEQWFLFRLGLLRILLAGKDRKKDGAFKKIYQEYQKILNLRFNDRKSLNVIELAKETDPFGKLAELLPRLAEGTEVQFEPFSLREKDPFMLDFFRHLTDLVSNQYGEGRGWADRSQATLYQPLLTRPLEEGVGEDASEAQTPAVSIDIHAKAGQQIENRIPPYEKIESGQQALSMFLGVVNFSVGHGKQQSRFRCLIAMIRDYDDAQTGAGLRQQEREQQLEVDRRDLSLYTTTFFRNVRKFVEDALAREENRILSTDITQIARNWYSSGVDEISRNLRQKLDQLAEDRTDFRLGGLRPEIVDTLFDSMLTVLLRTERRPDAEGRDILLESFPFDRLLHIPLGLGAADGARLCYARTRIVDIDGADGNKDSWSALSTVDCYRRIRAHGRTWPQSNGGKKAARVEHLRSADDKLVSSKEVAGLLSRIGEAGPLDALVRSLYEANAIQTLAVAGLILHALGNRDIGSMRQRLEAVVADNIRSVEQQAGTLAGKEVHTEVHMDRDAILRPLSPKTYQGSDADLRRTLQNVRVLPAWYDIFNAIEDESEDFIYGFRGPQGEVASKVFYVYYSIEAPVTFTEVPATGPRFRGIFALIVDDASTDDKSESREAEVADQQDIRTFVHNGVRSLQLILENQGLRNRLRQPGIESFVLGMLHRLKNELGKPMAVLHILGEKSESKEDKERIEEATSTIEGLKDLFKSLRGLGDAQQGVVPIRPFSTYWLGWLFIAKIAVAARKAAEELKLDAGELAASLKELEGIQKHAEKSLNGLPKDPLRSTETIQGELKKVEEILNLLASLRSSKKQELVLSFQVFSEVPLEFLGSFHLEEALNILIENAFQALWDYLGPLQDSIAESGLLRMVCRRSGGQSGEVLIEISNSSTEIDDSKLEILNNRVAQPMTSQQHASKSGKKGGSGFGHYYARRTVAELCGGREARRELDVRIGYQKEAHLARVSVNLMEASPHGLRSLSAERIQAEVRRNFESIATLALEKLELQYNLPQNLDVRSLFNLIRRFLVADREALERKFLSWWKSMVCSKLSDACNDIREAIFKKIMALEPVESEENGSFWHKIRSEIESPGGARIRRGSFHDLKELLRRLQQEEGGVLAKIVAGDKLLAERLKGLNGASGSSELEPQNLLDAATRRRICTQFERYKAHLQNGIEGEAAALLLKNVEQDERGQPVPARDGVASLLKSAQWKISQDVTEAELHLAISLVDGDPNDVQIDFGRERPADVSSTDYRLESQTFQTYSRLFERALRQGSPVGKLWLERGAEPPSRTVFLVLRKQEEMEAKV